MGLAGAAKERTSRGCTGRALISYRVLYGTIQDTYELIAISMSTIFTKIIEREIPGQFVYEDDVCVALMDKFPAVSGQVLVIPKEEVDYLFDVPAETYQHLCEVVKKVAKALDTVFETERTCVVVEGFEVPHAHIKLYPMTATDKNLGTVITETKEEADDVLQAQADKVKAALEA